MVRSVGGMQMFSISDLSKDLGLTIRTVRQWFMDGKLPGVKLGKEWYISEDNLKAFLNAETQGVGRKDRSPSEKKRKVGKGK